MNQPTPSSLLACLQAEIDAVRRFTQLLQEEAQSLTEPAAFEALNEITERKNQLAEELAGLGGQRNTLLGRMGLDSDHAGGQAAAAADPALAPVWQALLQAVAQARELNQRNGILLETHLRHVQHSLDALRALTGQASLYDAQGRARRVSPGKAIAAG
ncbi:flagellar protein FlgN [Orrella sp. JC864]|uniref:flagella synthesis protein FlgN n=1 Tax=Orrella sp. JC864 TaxID=3120298 RepID=UPI00300BCF10